LNETTSIKERILNKLLVTLLFAVAFLALSACTSSSSQSLVGQPWLLTELNGQVPIPNTTITAEFTEDGSVSGSSGCNQYTTSYTVDGDQLNFGEQVASTMMACLEPVMEQEREYLQALTATATFEIEDDVLVLLDADGNELARFVAVSQDLADTSWTVIGYNNGKGGVVSVIIGTEITANFSADGRLSGNSGCNNYSADYETEGESISIGEAEVTEMACPEPEGIMEQEQLYLAALYMAETYKVEEIRLEMRTSDGALVADFQRVP
jgi:heat shock protein HslJ